MVEFALVTPVLIMLVVLVADFGRVFAASLAIEAAARNASEAMSNAYLAEPPGPLNASVSAGSDAYYQRMHAVAVKTVCDEMSDQPNTAYDALTSSCVGMPLIRICIHDNADTQCGSESQGAGVPTDCPNLASAMSNATTGGSSARWTEVRICYRFTPILADLPFLSFADIWLERARAFTIPCYFALGSDECG